MEKFRNIILALILLFLLLPFTALAGQFKVIRVYDGDTIKARGHDIIFKVRLAGIDAPEMARRKGIMSQPYAFKAKRYLLDMIYNKTVDIQGYGLDQFNQVLGVVYLDGKNINLEMLKVGMAEVRQGIFARSLDRTQFRKAEKEARKAKLGIWSQGDKYISPRKWYKIQRENNKSRGF